MPPKTKYKTGLIGIYRRKFYFFLVIFALGFIGVKINTSSFKADTPNITPSKSSNTLNIGLVVDKEGNIQSNNQTIGRVEFQESQDEVRMPVVDKPGQYYSRVAIELTLPSSAQNVKHEMMAIHGVGSFKSSYSGGNKITYEAFSVSPEATLSVIAQMPKGMIKMSLSNKIDFYFKQIKASAWLLTAIILPILTFVYLLLFLYMKHKKYRLDIPDQEIKNPPMAIPPAIVGALYRQKVGSREIAATLLDLAYRGNIYIVDKERGFAFGKGKFDNRLLGFEKILLTKIFKNDLSADSQEIEKRINDHFYSKKMSIVSSGIYMLATRLGYFKVNPKLVHAKYRFIGIMAFLISLSGFIIGLKFINGPSYALFFWVGMMISSVIIATIAGNIPSRTVIGQEVLTNWLAFKKFLSNPEEFPYSEDNQEIFQKYLSYAVVLDCEAAWAKRFASHSFNIPRWFISEKFGLSLEDFCLTLFPIISYVGRSLAALKEPGFE